MTRDELVHELADEATRLIKTGRYKTKNKRGEIVDDYGAAISAACHHVKSLKSDVGKVLNKRGQWKRMIKKIVQEEAEAKKTVPAQAKLPLPTPTSQTTYNNQH